jgi:hypothetical protein
MRKKIVLAILVATVFVAAATIWPREYVALPTCALPSGASATPRLDDAPPALVRALTQRIGEVVPVGARFDTTDVIWFEPGKFRRLMFIWNLSNRWVIATEHGGFVYNDPIFAFDISRDRREAVFLGENIAHPDSICSTASSLLDYRVVPPKDAAR